MPRLDSVLTLRDGRAVGYAEYGRAQGPAIVHCHGNGTCRLEPLVVERAAETVGIRLVALDRPGIGRSDPSPGYRLLDWPDDLVEVADQVGLERFAIEGVSAGAPFALACAYKIPERLTCCGLISPATGPFLNRAGSPLMKATLWALLNFPGLVTTLTRFATRFAGTDEASIDRTLVRNAGRLGLSDQRLLADARIRNAFAHATAEAYRQGADAPTKEWIVFGGPWGFEAKEVNFERIYLWQGEQDRVLPPVAAHHLAAALPHCSAMFYPGDGHLSSFVNHAAEIWHTLTA